MDDYRHTTPLTDETLEQDLARAVAIDPSPEFVARVRMRVANEPGPSAWRVSWTLSVAGGVVVAAAVVLAAVLIRSNRLTDQGAPMSLAARAIPTAPTTIPHVASAFTRPSIARPSTSSGRADSTRARGEPVEPRAGRGDAAPLFDARETAALRSLIAGSRDSRVDLTALLRPGAPAPMELPPVEDLSIAAIAIEPIAPLDGAQGVRQ